MRHILMFVRIVAAFYLPVAILGWLWFDVRLEWVFIWGLVPALALAVGAFVPDRLLRTRGMKTLLVTLCILASVQYIMAALVSFAPRMGPDSNALFKQVALVFVFALLALRALVGPGAGVKSDQKR